MVITFENLHLLKSMASGLLKIKKGLFLYLYWPLGVTLLRVYGKNKGNVKCLSGLISLSHYIVALIKSQ